MANAVGSSEAQIKNPGPIQVSSGVMQVLIVMTIVGMVVFGIGLGADSKRAWAAFIQNHFYFMSLALGGLFFAAIQFLTGAMWSAPVRRVAESFTSYLPVVVISFAVLAFFGLKDAYIWMDPAHVQGNIILEHKAGYLNKSFFIVRNFIAIGLWLFFTWKIVGNSLKQDVDGSRARTESNRKVAPVFLFLFAITFTMSAFDQLMSLDPEWFSTMFGVYMFAGLFYSVLAATTILTILLKRGGALQGIVNENHLHDLGKFMFAFTAFWAYIGFSQFMLIWYANLPEETGYFMHRLHGGWFWVSIFLMVGKFVVPFVTLLSRENKRNESTLLFAGVFMLIAQWIDNLWVVQPEFFRDGPHVSWIEIGTFIGFAGMFGLCVARFLGQNSVVAIRDPKLAESVHHHHQ